MIANRSNRVRSIWFIFLVSNIAAAGLIAIDRSQAAASDGRVTRYPIAPAGVPVPEPPAAHYEPVAYQTPPAPQVVPEPVAVPMPPVDRSAHGVTLVAPKAPAMPPASPLYQKPESDSSLIRTARVFAWIGLIALLSLLAPKVANLFGKRAMLGKA